MPDINDKALREHLVSLLNGGNAHVTFEATLKGLPVALRGKRPKGAAHSPWEILEHLRITQWDILEFSKIKDNKHGAHVSPKWPDDYWTKTVAPPNARAWNQSVKSYHHDLQEMRKLVTDEATDLFAPIPHGNGQTVLREALLIADHTAYHLGEMLVVRRLLGTWK